MSDVQEKVSPPEKEDFVDDIDASASEFALTALPLLLPISKAAQLLGISRSAAYRCAAAGDLPTAHLGGRIYVVTARLLKLLESG
jgi:Helix-turn-helix domain